jgi:hypothetical protein
MNAQQNKTALANYALSKIGGKIFNFGDGSTSDVVMSAIYDQCRRFLHEECPWSFDIRTLQLEQLAVSLLTFGDNIQYCYQLPSDFLKIYKINFPYAYLQFENIPGNGLCLLSDTAGLIIKYVFDNDDPTTYSAKFYEALACKLAKEACFKLVEATKYQSKMDADYEKAFTTAAASDGQMSTADQVEESEWEWSRLAGSSGFVYYPGQALNVGYFPYTP